MAAGACRPITTIEDIKHRKKRECEECVKIGSDWVQLRTCHECGVLCCDNSPNRHTASDRVAGLLLSWTDHDPR